MRHLSVDVETYSSVNLADCGAYKYAESEDFEVLLFGYSVDFGEPEVIDLACGEDIPMEIVMMLFDPTVRKHAFNAAFEWITLSRYFKLTRKEQLAWARQWHCTMIHAYYLGYAGNLDMVGKAVGLPEDKQKLATGKALIRYFSCPVKATKTNGGRTRNLPHHDPEKWKLYKEYNRMDVVAETNIYMKLKGISVPDFIWEQWFTDLKINSRGVPMDHELIIGAIECDRIDREHQMSKFKQLTGLANPASNTQLLSWVTQHGVDMPNMQKATVADTLKRDDLPEEVRGALELKKEVSKTSIRKYNKMLDYECRDGRARGIIQFYGASSTGRYAGRGLQIQNLKRCYLSDLDTPRELAKQQNYEALNTLYDSVSDTLSQLIRTALVASSGHILLDADFSAIEARVLAVLAGEQWIIDEFKGDGKLYEATAAQMFGVPKEQIKKGTELYKLRQQGKVASLACQYQGSVNALTSMDFNHEIPDEQKPGLVSQWRSANPHIVQFWYAIENACIDTIKTGTSHRVGKYIKTELVSSSGISYLRIRLPSGRHQYYVRPSIGINRFGKESIVYKGKNQATGKWGDRETYGGSLTEGITQAVARDLLAEALERLEANGFEVLFHVHDEAVVDYPSVSEEVDQQNLEKMYSIMSEVPAWFSEMPLKSDGWKRHYYIKD
nr:MAG TPA: DNA polymerase I [Caudoviricetes sp.]